MNPNYWRKALLAALASFGATAQTVNPQTWQDWLHAALVGIGAGALVYYVPNGNPPEEKLSGAPESPTVPQ